VKRVIVVGAGPAGAALSYLLARRGVEVAVVERQTDFEREFRGEGLMPSGVDAFVQMGLKPELDALPYATIRHADLFRSGRRIGRFDIGSALPREIGPRFISQPHVLELMVAQSARFPGYRLERGALVEGLIWENGRVAGVSVMAAGERHELRADLVVGADGRGSTLRRLAGLHERRFPQDFDVVWVKVPLPDFFENGTLTRIYIGRGHFCFLFPSADRRLQIAWTIAKGTFGDLRRQGLEAWIEEMAGHVTSEMAAHLRGNLSDLEHPHLLNVVSDRLERWTAPGLLLIGDSAHPMSPVGAQGINIGLRDALVAANHLVPVLTRDASHAEVDAAAARVERERLPEVSTIQKLQERPPLLLFERALWSPIVWNLLPIFNAIGLTERAAAPIFHRLAFGVENVTLAV
jgi:2-polyprenyl-6-methoxyphenol hydroxylase-like FAD-dependent oxidoreductase